MNNIHIHVKNRSVLGLMAAGAMFVDNDNHTCMVLDNREYSVNLLDSHRAIVRLEDGVINVLLANGVYEIVSHVEVELVA